jgi:protein disulfide isomerase
MPKRYVIQQVPSIKLFRRGIMFPYEGPGQHVGVADLVQYLKNERAKQGLEENPVITLTNDNFDDIVDALDLILVEFYTDMCLPCQRLEPVFTEAARQLLSNSPPVRLGRVQIPDQIEVAKRFPLEGYPLLIMFRHGAQYNYTGPKNTAAGIVEYMRQQAGPSSIPLASTEDVKKFVNTREISVVAYFHDNPDLLREFLESGNLVRTDMELGHTQNEGVALQMKQQPGTIVVYHPSHLVTQYESGYSVITSPPSNATELRGLYLEHACPLVGQMMQRNYDTVYRHRPLLLAYYEVDWSFDGLKATQYWHNMVASVANQFCDSDIVFAVANEEDYPDDLRALGLSEWGEEVAVALFAPGPLKYPMTEELTRDSLTDFLQSFIDGDLTPHFSSEPPPKPVKGALIRKVVGSTFVAEVGNEKKDVMVMLCIPSLPDCKQASEYYLKLATQFKRVKNLVFSEMNVALNDPPVGTAIDTLPTFLFSPRGSQEISPVTPQPKDEADLAFFLKWKQNIKPQGTKVKKRKEEL